MGYHVAVALSTGHRREYPDAGTARRFEGTGLGLSLTKKIVEFQKGSIDVESEFGRGSTFTAVFPKTTNAEN